MNAQNTQDLASFYLHLVERLNNDFRPAGNYAFSSLLAGSLTIFSKYMEQVQEPAKTELKDLSSSMQLHVDSLCGVLKTIADRGMDMDQHDTRREVELIIETMATYASLVRYRPDFEQSKLPTAMAHLITCALYPTTSDR